MRNQMLQDQYSSTMDSLRALAQQDLLDWWAGQEGSDLVDVRSMLEDPFSEIVRVYGAEASAAAADYVFLQRSLDEELSGLAYPSLANPISFEQAKASARWATKVRDAKMLSSDDGEVQEAIKRDSLAKLQGTVNRLVAFPGRETVWQATVEAGTHYARVPEPRACNFCLILASRGAVYSRETVTSRDGIHAYHDNCRCLGIEVRGWDDLPTINKDLAKAYEDGSLTMDSPQGSALEAAESA